MTVSVVIPVYNVQPYLGRCVRSVLNQTYKDLEIILVDDGSTDGSGDLCDQIAAGESRIHVIHQQNQGLSGARNTGIREAKGDFVIFLDSDDEWLLNDGIEKLLANSHANEELIIFKAVDVWKHARKNYSRDYDIENISCLPNAQAVFSHLIVTQQFRMSACFLLVRRQLLTDHQIFFPLGYISEDIDWSLHIWQHANKVIVTNLPFYGYYHREASISTTASLRVYDSYDKLFSYWKDQCQRGCINADAIRVYMSNLWVSRGYGYHQLPKNDKPQALNILTCHSDLLNYANTPKAKRTAALIHLVGVRWTVTLLGYYWRLRTIIKGNAL